MNKILLSAALCCGIGAAAQYTVKGRITDELTSSPLQHVVVGIQNTGIVTTTDINGTFELTSAEKNATLIFSRADFEQKIIAVKLPLTQSLALTLTGKIAEVEGVVLTTGYQKLPKERATGSFSTVSSQMLGKQVSVNILERLPTAANGIVLNKGLKEGPGQIMVRGLSTIKGPTSPLIVLDNFPYEGDFNNINPNTVESITVLKDAAASSIWGARAANGVIVITTKTGKFNQPIALDFNTSLTLSDKPDLSKLPVMNTSDFIDVETVLFGKGYYNSAINSTQHPVISPVVNLLNKAKLGTITQEEATAQINAMRTVDVRDQYLKYMYRPMENRQYALNISGGYPTFSWVSSLGYDENSGNLEEKYRRMNLKFQNTWKPLSRLTLGTGVSFNQSKSQSGRSAYGTVTVKNAGLPYLKFADESGNALAVPKQYNQDYINNLGGGKLLDWNYYPLTDWQHSRSTGENTELILNASLNYRIIKGLEAEVRYQHHRQNGMSESFSDMESYYTRNYINLFTVISPTGSVTYNIPKGDIFGRSTSLIKVDNFRGQLNYNRNWNRHQVSAILGGESRSANTQYISNLYYGYNPESLSFGTVNFSQAFPVMTGGTRFIDKGTSLNEFNNNFVSTFANASYTFDSRYTVSASARRDASNLFGLSTNDLWNPFWSAGLGWEVSKEPLYRLKWLPYLKLRGSLGYNGNIDPSMVAVTTVKYSANNSQFTNSPMAQFNNYYNPRLRWESLRMLNIAADFETANKRIGGYVEFFRKKGENLFGTAPMDYTTGITSLTWNVAGMQGQGVDVQLRSVNIDRAFRWNTLINFSTYHDKVTKYYLANTFGRQFLLPTVPISGVEGLPVYSVFAYKWAGLDPVTGDPQGYLNGELSKDYAKITGTGTDVKDLEYFGSAIPTVYGNFTNTFSYRQFSLDIGLTYKLGYWFRRPSINYTNLFTEWIGHSDYSQRWQKPGDEAFTNVPSNLYQTNTNRDAFYAGSSVLVEKGDHIRLQYINLTYRIDRNLWRNAPFKAIELYANAGNLGMIWQASKSGVDPDYNLGNNTVIPGASYTLGLKANF
ncbi:MAG: SusC/RagA family TonB-linked outer membrane protein [Flavobacteriia bacterium]|nr:SusC/RagA family TonB-linked outer membrane protein [Flavobacteriia bacterium]